jgi:hypothetical protein
MLEVEQSADASSLRAGDLRLTFRYERDRWRHELAVRSESGWQTILTSIEGSPDEALPPSPSFQDLRLERIDDETGEFQLFGQAGHAVYSAAIRFDGRSQTISFDIAARAQRDRAERCATSLYELSPLVNASEIGIAENVLLSAGCGSLVLSASLGTVADSSAPASGADLHRTIVIGCRSEATSGDAPPPRNARWQYAFRLVRRP